MARIKYIGQITNQVGKTLWEIVGNLKNYGEGRLITRGSWQKYPEPSFYKIVKVDTQADDREKGRKVIAWVEEVMRGDQLPKLKEILSITYKPDFQLIPKDEEALWWKKVEECPSRRKIIDPFMPLPPLLKLIITQEKKALGEPVGDLKANILISKSSTSVRFPEEGDKYVYDEKRSDFGIPVTPHLYENIEAARPLFVGKSAWDDYRKYSYRNFWVFG